MMARAESPLRPSMALSRGVGIVITVMSGWVVESTGIANVDDVGRVEKRYTRGVALPGVALPGVARRECGGPCRHSSRSHSPREG